MVQKKEIFNLTDTALFPFLSFSSPMFFETTYVPSPQLSATSTVEEGKCPFHFSSHCSCSLCRFIVDDLTPPPLSPSVGPAQGDSSCDEGMSDSPVDHVIFVIHASIQTTFSIL